MSFQFAALIVFLILIGYIIYLQIKLSSRNVFIETALKNLSGIEGKSTREEILDYLKEIRELGKYGPISNDKLTSEESLKFLFEKENELRTFIHYTKEEFVAENIVKNGFIFSDSFYKTALKINNDKLDLRMKHSGRRFYGDYIIVISISADLLRTLASKLENAGHKNFIIENFLTETEPQLNENNDLIYTLPAQFIKGYLNYKTGAIVKNSQFDPSYFSQYFSKNIENYNKSYLNS